jgi:hypothetical protein
MYMAFRINEAVVMVRDLARLYDKYDTGRIWYSEFKKYIIERHGADDKTIRMYYNALNLFGFAKRDTYDPDLLLLTYKTAPDYIEYQDARKKALTWFTSDDGVKDPNTSDKTIK